MIANEVQLYPNLQLEQIYATILYFLSKPVQVTQYMSDWLDYCQTSEQEQDENPPAYIQRLRQLKAERSLVK
ncbi:hypothetical protein PN462_23160 [Spirulina sp. CS-785/01]|uniref:hypothetical protein n=1 Tax=Spirulina sp. CS-785/01 TaxID=3021716 RepID=UPI00232B7F08|nr:hypothetical protein [Spirulina sp. CS-785/01]MDB9316029.1 hypothetical protein [Spirulina sp. CS-785/01]